MSGAAPTGGALFMLRSLINRSPAPLVPETASLDSLFGAIDGCARAWMSRDRVPCGAEPLSMLACAVLALKPWRLLQRDVSRDALFRGLLFRGALLTTLDGGQEPEMLHGLLAYERKKLASPPCRFKVDEAFMGESALLLYEKTKDPRLVPLAQRMAEAYKALFQGSAGAVPYHQGCSHIVVDSVAMLCPFLARYGAAFSDAEAVACACRQLDEFCEHGLEPRTGIPYHGYDAKNGFMPLGLFGWGRGAGWFAMGLLDTLALLPRGSARFRSYAAAARKLIASLERLACPGGGWRSLLTDGGRPREGSATAMLGYAVLRAVEEGVVPEAEGMRLAAASVQALKAMTRLTGEVGYAQGDCLALDRMSSCYEPNAYAQGMAVALVGRWLARQKGASPA